uniref:Uncharacterized protein n=1 Tax=Sus scrofa TaxID=9823 RepID=Q6YT48_PIG|nr:hypothetical protein [Sus scrofa]
MVQDTTHVLKKLTFRGSAEVGISFTFPWDLGKLSGGRDTRCRCESPGTGIPGRIQS